MAAVSCLPTLWSQVPTPCVWAQPVPDASIADRGGGTSVACCCWGCDGEWPQCLLCLHCGAGCLPLVSGPSLSLPPQSNPVQTGGQSPPSSDRGGERPVWPDAGGVMVGGRSVFSAYTVEPGAHHWCLGQACPCHLDRAQSGLGHVDPTLRM